MKTSRRSFVKFAACASLVSASKGFDYAQTIGNVRLGVETFSFHDFKADGQNHTDDLIRDMKACGLTSCDLFSPQIEPGGAIARASLVLQEHAGSRGSAFIVNSPDAQAARKARAEQTRWRATVPVSFWEDVAKKFRTAGIEIYSYSPTFYPDSSDEEMARLFEFGKALGAKYINTSTSLTILKRIIPQAEKHKMAVGVHNHGGVADPDQISLRDSFTKAFAMSPWVWANLDVGHYFASGGDPVEFIQTFHKRITNIHLKDRLKNDGPGVPFGKGDVPLREVLLLLKRNNYQIPAFIEYEYASDQSALFEIKRSLDYCRQILS
jgi:sugar phosphate isomerase/epimerase